MGCNLSMDTVPTALRKYLQPGKVFIFSVNYCPFCTKVRNLLKSVEVPFEIMEVNEYPELFNDKKFIETLHSHSGMRTYPKVYIGEKCIGGYSETVKMKENMKLFIMLKENKIPFPGDDQI